ncbi:MAG: 2-aminomuconate deaminase [Candidatus Melainabacteria bacterium HGW-Melainabacteria-1]|nr:MAG: 2-aminomuconate deaminase [Candidatus Melainabacteria bacterium HGW-Melainabacteria-1]
MNTERIETALAPPPVGPYPHARRVGDLLFLSGVGPRQPGTSVIPGVSLDPSGQIMSYDIVAQTHAVMANVKVILAAAGARWADLVDITVYLTDMQADFATVNALWRDYFPDPETQPCRTTVEVGALPTPIAIELKCIAYLGGRP